VQSLFSVLIFNTFFEFALVENISALVSISFKYLEGRSKVNQRPFLILHFSFFISLRISCLSDLVIIAKSLCSSTELVCDCSNGILHTHLLPILIVHCFYFGLRHFSSDSGLFRAMLLTGFIDWDSLQITLKALHILLKCFSCSASFILSLADFIGLGSTLKYFK